MHKKSGDPDFSKYGEFGAKIQRVQELRWELATAKWKENRANQPHGEYCLLPLGKILKALDRSVFWFNRFQLALTELEAFSSTKEFEQFWNEKFRRIFSPPLKEYSVLARSDLVCQCFYLHQTMAQIKSPEFYEQSKSLNGVTYSAFSQEEIDYLKHRSVVDIGCGSGYLLSSLGERAIGIDKHSAGNFEWTRNLIDSGRLIIGDTSLLSNKKYADCTLVISWPRYGAPVLADALEEFAKAGGQSLLLKFGVYVDWRVICYLDASAGKNFRAAMDILARDWQQIRSRRRPTYHPKALGNNSWIFERRPSHA